MKVNSIKCPCEGCLCVPICRHKNYYSLFHECYLLSTYVQNPYVWKICINELKNSKKILQPTCWTICANTVIIKCRVD